MKKVVSQSLFGIPDCWAQQKHTVLFKLRLIQCMMAPNRATAPRTKSRPCFLQYVCMEGEELQAPSSPLCRVNYSRRAHTGHPHNHPVCRLKAHLQKKHPLRAIILHRDLQSIRRTVCALLSQCSVIFSVAGTKTEVQPTQRLFPYQEGFRAREGNSLWSAVVYQNLTKIGRGRNTFPLKKPL